MRFWKPRVSKPKRFVVDVVMLLLTGLGLFIMTTQLVEPFSKVATVLDRTPFLDGWRAWAHVFALALPVGVLWLGFFMVFEATKEDLLSVMSEDEADHRVEKMTVRRDTLARRRRAMLVQKRLAVTRQKL